jgi:gamma-glutamylcyclotransferase (GGCT)/AIG2-like uncharacterized protein YtfP
MNIPEGHHAVFVYGTLKNPSKTDDFVVKGKLFDIGSFPGVVLGDEKEIPGQVAIVNDAKLAALDVYEGVPNLYTRERTTARLVDAPFEAIDVWVYQWNGGTDSYTEIDRWE